MKSSEYLTRSDISKGCKKPRRERSTTPLVTEDQFLSKEDCIRFCERPEHNATHISDDGDYWIIPPPGHEDGTGSVWIDGKWCTSEISDDYVKTLEVYHR